MNYEFHRTGPDLATLGMRDVIHNS